MAEWKKIIFEDVNTSLKSLASGRDSDATSGNIEGNFALFGTTDEATGGTGALSVVISGSGAGLEVTSSDAFVNPMNDNPLDFQVGSGLSLNSGNSYDGTGAKTATVNTLALAGLGLNNDDDLINVGAGNNITVNTADVAIASTGIADNDFGLKMSGNKLQIATGSGFKFGASGTGGALTKLAPNESGGVKGAGLSGWDTVGINITNTAYDYTDAETISLSVADFTGTGLVSTDNNLNLATSSLSSGTGSKWNGSALAGTNLSEGTDALLLAGEEVVVPGVQFNVAGTVNYAHESDVEITDKLLLINSASSQFGATAQFGFLGQTGSAAHGLSLFYSGSGTANDIGWFMGAMSNIGTDDPGATKGRVRMHVGQAEATPDTLTFTGFQLSTGNSYFDTGDIDSGFYVYV